MTPEVNQIICGDVMKIKGLAPWFGSKRSLAPTIVELIGPHRVYWEPFCGSMAILLAKPPCEMETVNDLHGDIINLARVIQDKEMGFQLYDKLNRTLYAEELFKEAKARWISQPETNNEPDIDRAYDYFIVSWMGLNGVSGTKRYNYPFALRWCLGGGQGARRWSSVIKSIPTWHKRLQNVVIIKRDAFGILGNIKDEKGTVIYCDPPYLVKGAKYIHDFEDSDHIKLAELLRRFNKAKVVVSYYDDLQLADLYPNWQQYKIEFSKAMSHVGGRGQKNVRAIEVLLTNQKVDQKGLFE